MSSVITLVSPDPAHARRLEWLAKNLTAECMLFQNVDEASEKEGELAKAAVVYLSGTDAKNDSDLAGRVQVVKYAAPDSWIIVVAEKRLKTESAEFLKKSGAQFVLLEDEFVESCKPEFVGSQKIHGEWIPMKGSELKAGSLVPMNLYHFMPLNLKFLPFLTANSVVDEAKAQKAVKAGEVYFKREDVLLFHEYTKAHEDKSAAGLVSRCRRQYLSMNLVYKDLVLLLTDQSEAASFQKGKDLLDRTQKLADDFITSLASVGDAWQVVNNAGFDDLTPVDRAPAIASAAGLMSLMSGIGNATEVFLAALLADVGLLDLPPRALMLWKQGKLNDLHPEDAAFYRNHPNSSLHRILKRKIPLADSIKEIVQNSHERIDGKGFPAQPLPEKIPPEAMLVQLAEMLDTEMKWDFGKEKRDPLEVRKQVLEREKSSLKAFPYGFLSQIEKAF